jgi:hypothetical protein
MANRAAKKNRNLGLALSSPACYRYHMQALVITSVKNEGAFLLEWLAHHRKVGFHYFLVFSNDCNDGTDLMLDRLAKMGWLTHEPNPGPHREGPQWAALKAADKHPIKASAEWVLFADVDEFVNVHTGDHSLQALWSALPQADAIALTWRLFGNAGVIDFEDQPLTRTFTQAAPETLGWPWRAQMFKTLFRNDGAHGKLGVHHPRSPNKSRAPRWYDGAGRDVTQELSGGRLFSDYRRANYDLVQLNHYALGSMESYLVKADRGRANRDADAFDMGYWIERNLCEVEDRSIDATDSSDLRADLLADAVLGPLHHAAVAWRKARFAELMTQDEWRWLFGRLLMAPTSRSLPPALAARLQAYSKP